MWVEKKNTIQKNIQICTTQKPMTITNDSQINSEPFSAQRQEKQRNNFFVPLFLDLCRFGSKNFIVIEWASST